MSHRRWLFAALIIAVGLRAGATAVVFSGSFFVDDDGFLARARQLVAGQPLAVALTGPDDVVRPPLYPIALVPSAFSGRPAVVAVLENICLGTLAVIPMWALGQVVAGRRGGAIAAMLAACWPQWVTAVVQIRSEHLLIPLEAGALACAIRSLADPDSRAVFVGGALFGLSALSRSTAFFQFLPVAIALAWWRPRAAARMTLIVLGIIAPFVLWLSVTAGRFVFIDNMLAWNWRAAAHQQIMLGYPIGSSADLIASIRQVMARDGAIPYLREALGHLHFVLFSPLSWEHLIEMYPAALMRVVDVTSALMLVVVYDAAALAPWITSDRRPIVLLGLWTAALIPALIGVPGTVMIRYRASIEPALMALACVPLARIGRSAEQA